MHVLDAMQDNVGNATSVRSAEITRSQTGASFTPGRCKISDDG
jgi:hypothetical protein